MQDFNTGVLFILGIGVFGGILGAWFFQKIKIPQVMGYVTIGIILGMSGFKVVDRADIAMLQPFNLFALGIIGFLVGGELKVSIFKKYARQFTAILIGEGTAAFVIVSVGSSALIYYICGELTTACATGVVFGAIASATDPASTISVLWESRAKGVLTSSITAIVALDDALAMTLYGIGTSCAQMLTSDSGSITHELGKVSFELLGAIIAGGLFGFLLNFLLKWLHQKEKSLTMALGLLLLLISISDSMGLDVILASMTTGFILINYCPLRGEKLLETIREFSTPIYALFFVLVGARLELNAMPLWLWGVVAIYIIGRSIGKIAGSYFGAKITNSDPRVRNYLGMGIMAQGGVAVGLSIVASQHLGHIMIDETLSAGDAIIFAVTATTLIAQMIGPPLTKLAIKLAGEIDRDITEEDVVESLSVLRVVDTECTAIAENMTLHVALNTLVDSTYKSLPVINSHNSIKGILSLEDMKELIFDQDSWEWLIVGDVIDDLKHSTLLAEPLKESLTKMRDLSLECMPVIEDTESMKYSGMLSLTKINKIIAEELVKQQGDIK